MLTRDTFLQRFGRKPIFGMVHLRALPGAPLFGGSLDAVIEAARADVQALASGGCDGLLFENFGDRPFRKTEVDPETIAAMTRVITEARQFRVCRVPLMHKCACDCAGPGVEIFI